MIMISPRSGARRDRACARSCEPEPQDIVIVYVVSSGLKPDECNRVITVGTNHSI